MNPNAKSSNLPSIELLYHRKDTAFDGYQVPPHRHGFWQLEWVEQGRVEIVAGNRPYSLNPGDVILIPPETEHRLRYRQEVAYLSFKFRAQAGQLPNQIQHWEGTDFQTKVASLLQASIPRGEDLPHREMFTTHCLSLALYYLLEVRDRNTETEPVAKSLVDRALQRIETGRGRVDSVKMLARELGCSADYLSAEFRRVRGRNLKAYLDLLRIGRAKSHLTYSERSVSGIAETLGFPDVFSFSRFFRRHTGMSPKAFRQKGRSGIS